MLMTLLGWFLVVMGVFFFLRPSALRDSLRKKSYKKIRGLLFLVTLAAAGLFISAGWQMQGGWAKVVLILGVIGILKAFFILKAKAAETLVTWFAGRPLVFFRMGGALEALAGLTLLMLHGR